jgi:hypothetical protein
MRRFGLFLIAIVVASLALASTEIAPAASGLGLRSSTALAATDPIGCPDGPPGPVSPTASYPCPVAGGSVVNGVYVPPAVKAVDPLQGSGGPVCIAVPIFLGSNKGSCKEHQYEIANNPATGGAIVAYLILILKLVNELVGMVIILVLIIAGIQYITSVGDPTRIKSAKKRITQAITALVLYMLSIAILTFLIPGGLIG